MHILATFATLCCQTRWPRNHSCTTQEHVSFFRTFSGHFRKFRLLSGFWRGCAKTSVHVVHTVCKQFVHVCRFFFLHMCKNTNAQICTNVQKTASCTKCANVHWALTAVFCRTTFLQNVSHLSQTRRASGTSRHRNLCACQEKISPDRISARGAKAKPAPNPGAFSVSGGGFVPFGQIWRPGGYSNLMHILATFATLCCQTRWPRNHSCTTQEHVSFFRTFSGHFRFFRLFRDFDTFCEKQRFYVFYVRKHNFSCAHVLENISTCPKLSANVQNMKLQFCTNAKDKCANLQMCKNCLCTKCANLHCTLFCKCKFLHSANFCKCTFHILTSSHFSANAQFCQVQVFVCAHSWKYFCVLCKIIYWENLILFLCNYIFINIY